MNATKEIQTYSPISGLHVCANGTGNYVEKADYDRLLEENTKLAKERDKWRSCAEGLALHVREWAEHLYEDGSDNYEEEAALKHFEELSE